jgi:hypothetical protein
MDMSLGELLSMLELSKEIARSQATEQKNILDTILDGAQKAAQIVNNIQSISSGNDPKPTQPLFKEEQNMAKPPVAPSFFAVQPTTPEADPFSVACDAISSIRDKMDKIYKTQSYIQSDLQPIIKELYDLHLALYRNIKK